MEHKTIGDQLRENESVMRLIRDGNGTATVCFEQKALLSDSSVGSSTSGSLTIDRARPIIPASRRRLFMRDLLTAVPTRNQIIDFMRETTGPASASPQMEGSPKTENAIALAAASERVRTIGTWIQATRQIVDDVAELEGFLTSTLAYAVRKEEDRQIIAGSGSAEELNGFVHQATPFDTSVLSAADGWEYADIIARAKEQIELADETDPGFVAFHPTTWWNLRRLKSGPTGQWLYADPSRGDSEFGLWGVNVVRTKALALDQFVIGSVAPTAAVLRDRQELSVEISYQHSDYFVRNKVAVRAEERVALVCYRPAAYVTGSLSRSPV